MLVKFVFYVLMWLVGLVSGWLFGKRFRYWVVGGEVVWWLLGCRVRDGVWWCWYGFWNW